jgi:hypothetical protein
MGRVVLTPSSLFLCCVVDGRACGWRGQSYDSAVGSWFKAQVSKDGGEPEQAGASGTAPTVATPATTTVAAPPVAATSDTRTYKPALTLKYGCNPHQKPAYVGTINGERAVQVCLCVCLTTCRFRCCARGHGPLVPRATCACCVYPIPTPPPLTLDPPTPRTPLSITCTPPPSACPAPGAPLPFSVVSGTPGYINLLDATNAWQLVREASAATGVPVAASFKHVSPAGVGLGLPLSPQLAAVYDVKGDAASGSPLALAYIRACHKGPLFLLYLAVYEAQCGCGGRRVWCASTVGTFWVWVSDV